MAAAIRRGLPRLPREIDVVVGIPRSGLTPALLVALYKNAMVTDPDGLLEGRGFPPGTRRTKPNLAAESSRWRNVLVIDDSVDSGRTFGEICKRLDGRADGWNVTLCAVYGAPKDNRHVDIVLEHCPQPRIFEWNLVHHPDHMRSACLDIDGVLCLDPTKEENDDGLEYDRFLANARPNLIPTVPVGTLVTSRLEKYRRQTEDWLHQAGVEFDELYMLDLPTAAERRRLKAHAPFKAEVYAAKRESSLFLESDEGQARQISQITGKAVVCTDTMTLFGGSLLSRYRRSVSNLRDKLWRRFAMPRG
jgi:uncharacterized HAD superfamily protein/adenine/guanine phosphoribosyltransferase-like PRPP-binding protein